MPGTKHMLAIVVLAALVVYASNRVGAVKNVIGPQ